MKLLTNNNKQTTSLTKSLENLKTNLLKALQARDLTFLMTLANTIDLDLCIRSGEKIIKFQDKGFVNKSIILVCENYLKESYPAQVGTGIGFIFANYIIEMRCTWNMFDIVNFFKFIRTRKDIEGLRVFGNTLTPDKLIEFTVIYEEHRAMKVEEVINESRNGEGFERKFKEYKFDELLKENDELGKSMKDKLYFGDSGEGMFETKGKGNYIR